MSLTLTAICVTALCLLIAMWIKRARDQDQMEQYSITPEALHTLLASNHEVLVFDVRQPLDLLADPEIIVGELRDLMRYRRKLVESQAAERNLC